MGFVECEEKRRWEQADIEILRSISHIICTVTDRKRAEQFREEYVHSISHDLRAPLTVIQGQAQLIERFVDEKDLVRQGALSIVQGARRMNGMIQDLVDSARLETGQMLLQRQPVQLKRFIGQLLEQAAGVSDFERISVEVHPDLPPVDVDADCLERILMNLLTNALKYSSPGSEVMLIARLDGAMEAVISVVDRGKGISPTDLLHIFDRFYRSEETGKIEGLGLGLYITRMLVETHGGRIWAESELEKGSAFYFTLPLAL
jgi:signal transduction histidine kinase